MAKVRKSGIAVAITVLLAVAAAGYFFIDQASRDKARAAAASAAPPGIPVTVGIAQNKDLPVYVRGIGTVQAYKMVTIKSRVDGQIMKVAFEEGQEVKAGDPLFQIDPRPFQAALDQATANKQRSEAQLTGAEADLERYGKLIGSGYQSRQSFDQQKAIADALKGAIAGDQAAIDTAKLNLGYADIRAPIDGRTGSRQVDPGNLVQASQNTALVTITQIRPIFVNFTVPQDQTDKIRDQPGLGSARGRGLRQRRQDGAWPGQAHADREPDRRRHRHAAAQGHVREYRREAMAGRVRQRPAGAVDPQGRRRPCRSAP